MVYPSLFKKTVFISALGHIALFGIFSFSFADKLPRRPDFASVYFWGKILSSSDLVPMPTAVMTKSKEERSYYLCTTGAAPTLSNCSMASSSIKPQINLAFIVDKTIFRQQPILMPSLKRKNEQVIMFHPRLPYSFLLFFKDRQTAHIELMFNIVSRSKANSTVIKRKISSGNLEADLLTMRYIGHYLSVEQAKLTTDNWQTVKIDLSPKESQE